MKFLRLFGFARNYLLAFCRWFTKLNINAHQVFAHFRNRARRGSIVVKSSETTNVELAVQQDRTKNHPVDEPLPSHIQDRPSSSPSSTSSLKELRVNHIKNKSTKRSKLSNLFRRFSLSNFMEYCVIALNEASGSGCSNRFDFSSYDKPVWLLGRQYDLPSECDQLIDDVRSKIWITYRRNFPPIDNNPRYTSDRGFGCMIRCGQMVLANALIYKNLGRDWRWSSTGIESNPGVYYTILKLFQDKEQSPYSIHNIVQSGQHEGRAIGEWFGPNTIAQALKRMSTSLCLKEPDNHEILISVDAALDNIVATDEIKSRFKQSVPGTNGDEKQSIDPGVHHQEGQSREMSSNVGSNVGYDTAEEGRWMPGILFIQLRLGLTKINPLYFSGLRKTFQFKNSLGIIGGRPNHALYLVGHTDNDIIYLDPHSTQQYIDLDHNIETQNDQPTTDETATSDQEPRDSTYHCSYPERMPLDRLDPSLALCFYFHNEQEFDDWCNQSRDLLIKSEQAPMFEITTSRLLNWDIPITSTIVKSPVSRNKSKKTNDVLNDSEEGKSESYGYSDKPVVLDSACDNSSHSDTSQQQNDVEEFEMLG